MIKPKDGEDRKKTYKAKKLRAELQNQKAEIFFTFYYKLGLERSLEKLQSDLAKIGLRRSLNTFKSYSVKYHWQARVIELDTKLRAERESKTIYQVEEMNKDQAEFGRHLRILASAGLDKIAEVVKLTGSVNLSPAEICRMGEVGIKAERLGMGEATDRMEVYHLVWNELALDIITIFNEVVVAIRNAELQKDIRRRFAVRVDSIRETKFLQIEASKRNNT